MHFFIQCLYFSFGTSLKFLGALAVVVAIFPIIVRVNQDARWPVSECKCMLFCFGLSQVTSCTPAMEMCSPSRRRKRLPPIWTLLSAPEHAEKATRYGKSENQWKCRNGAPYNLFEIQEVSFCEDLSAKLVFFILHSSFFLKNNDEKCIGKHCNFFVSDKLVRYRSVVLLGNSVARAFGLKGQLFEVQKRGLTRLSSRAKIGAEFQFVAMSWDQFLPGWRFHIPLG